MKNLILLVVVASLAGCAGGFKSWYTLRDECRAGVQASCEAFQSRNDVTGAMSAGLAGYNAQQLQQAQIDALNRANQPVIVTCDPNLNGGFTCKQ